MACPQSSIQINLWTQSLGLYAIHKNIFNYLPSDNLHFSNVLQNLVSCARTNEKSSVHRCASKIMLCICSFSEEYFYHLLCEFSHVGGNWKSTKFGNLKWFSFTWKQSLLSRTSHKKGSGKEWNSNVRSVLWHCAIKSFACGNSFSQSVLHQLRAPMLRFRHVSVKELVHSMHELPTGPSTSGKTLNDWYPKF